MVQPGPTAWPHVGSVRSASGSARCTPPKTMPLRLTGVVIAEVLHGGDVIGQPKEEYVPGHAPSRLVDSGAVFSRQRLRVDRQKSAVTRR